MRWSLLASGSYSVVQAALVIRGFVIRGFNYPRLVNFVQNLLSADISIGYPRIWSLFSGQKAI